jgi:hypothetical protein
VLGTVDGGFVVDVAGGENGRRISMTKDYCPDGGSGHCEDPHHVCSPTALTDLSDFNWLRHARHAGWPQFAAHVEIRCLQTRTFTPVQLSSNRPHCGTTSLVTDVNTAASTAAPTVDNRDIALPHAVFLNCMESAACMTNSKLQTNMISLKLCTKSLIPSSKFQVLKDLMTRQTNMPYESTRQQLFECLVWTCAPTLLYEVVDSKFQVPS